MGAQDLNNTARHETTRGLTKRWMQAIGPEAGSMGLVERVLAARGLETPDACDAFLNPTLGQLHDPSGIPGLDRAAERLLKAAKDREPIVIYGDYDVDGITATAILYHTIRAIAPGADIRSYVPHRLEEGYGLNADAMRTLAHEGARVVVSVDCGITAIEPARAARETGLDLIITDHHNPPAEGDELPDAYALVHPRLPGSVYPFGELCGAGVAYKLAWRLCTLACGSEKVSPQLRTLLVELLGPCALGVIADVVPLVGENRVIAKFGLSRVRSSPIVGLRALVEASKLADAKIDAEAVGFRIGPRLNACGRMGHAAEAVELLTTADEARSTEIAESLCRLNDERRTTERRITEQACRLAEAAGMTEDEHRAIVLAGDGWHPGVVGIVCSRLVEKYGRPAILLCRDGELCAGSGRSINGYNLHAGLTACAEHLETFGGHDMAAGLRVRADKTDAFVRAFVEHANGHIAIEDLAPVVRYDTLASANELTPAGVGTLEDLAPFGRDNPTVRVRLANICVEQAPKPFGKTGAHMSLTVRDGAGGQHLRCIGWRWMPRLAELGVELARGSQIDLLVTPKVSDWSGRVEPEIVDLRVCAQADEVIGETESDHSVVVGAEVVREGAASATSRSMR